MSEAIREGGANDDENQAPRYHPPAVTYLGSLAELTQGKEVGGADGTTFLGLELGSV